MCSYRNKAGHETIYHCDTCPDKPRMHLGRCFINYRKKKCRKDIKKRYVQICIYVGMLYYLFVGNSMINTISFALTRNRI